MGVLAAEAERFSEEAEAGRTSHALCRLRCRCSNGIDGGGRGCHVDTSIKAVSPEEAEAGRVGSEGGRGLSKLRPRYWPVVAQLCSADATWRVPDA